MKINELDRAVFNKEIWKLLLNKDIKIGLVGGDVVYGRLTGWNKAEATLHKQYTSDSQEEGK